MSSYLLPIAKRLSEEDIQGLISSGAREDRRIDFKVEYLPRTSGGLNKLMKAIAGFANARGGHVVMGIEEKGGVAVRIAPLPETDEDKCKLQILSSVRAQIRPALLGVDLQLVRLAAGGTVAVVFVPKSWNAPHMVEAGRFFIRHDAQTIPMDYDEIKEAFLAESSIAARLRAFRRERCDAISADRTTRPLYSQARIVLHVLPFDMLGSPVVWTSERSEKNARASSRSTTSRAGVAIARPTSTEPTSRNQSAANARWLEDTFTFSGVDASKPWIPWF